MEFNLEETKQKIMMLYYKKFVNSNFDELQIGDIVLSSTITYSQKYFLKEGYEDYNMQKYGVLLHKKVNDPENSIILAYDPSTKTFSETYFYKNPGTSGCFYLKKYVE
jgi:hypothetical protein